MRRERAWRPSETSTGSTWGTRESPRRSVSASRIRAALERGDVREARAMMGRPYEAIGEVVRGAGRGRAQGAPTANLAVANEVIPASGVYLTETRLEERLFPSLTNIGTR